MRLIATKILGNWKTERPYITETHRKAIKRIHEAGYNSAKIGRTVYCFKHNEDGTTEVRIQYKQTTTIGADPTEQTEYHLVQFKQVPTKQTEHILTSV